MKMKLPSATAATGDDEQTKGEVLEVTIEVELPLPPESAKETRAEIDFSASTDEYAGWDARPAR